MNNYKKYSGKRKKKTTKKNQKQTKKPKLPQLPPECKRDAYLEPSLRGKAFHFLLLQGVYPGSIEDPVYQFWGRLQMSCNIKPFNWNSTQSLRHRLLLTPYSTQWHGRLSQTPSTFHTFLFGVKKEHVLVLLLPLEIQQVELWFQSFDFLE